MLLTLAFLVVLFSRIPYHETIALVFFSIASLTDYYDGKIARRDKMITDFGILMDPLADKILICSAFIAFLGRQYIEAWMVVIVVARELIITGLRLLAASKQVILSAERFGKHKTISQIVAIIAILVLHSYPQWGNWATGVFAFWVPSVEAASKYVAVALTAISGGLYMWYNRQLYLKDI